MASTTRLKQLVNRILRPASLRLDTLTAQHQEDARLNTLAEAGYFQHPVFPVPAAVQRCNPELVLAEVDRHAARMRELAQPGAGDFGYRFDNNYYRSPDAEVYYAMIRHCRPHRIIEIGCGHSTRLALQAVKDGGLATELICIDPAPRVDVAGHVHEMTRRRVEELPVADIAGRLSANDILFIDSSHEIRSGNDVLFLYLHVLPALAAGVLVHIHDVFLPYEYPVSWLRDSGLNWTEQYLIQVLLHFGVRFDVLWPGHYLQRTHADFQRHFPNLTAGQLAQSLWLRSKEGTNVV